MRLTDKQTRELGKDRGKTAAESICLEPAFDRLPVLLEKYRKKKAWQSRAEAEKEYVVERYPDLRWEAFKTEFVAAGLKFTLSYIKELKDDGLLKDM